MAKKLGDVFLWLGGLLLGLFLSFCVANLAIELLTQPNLEIKKQAQRDMASWPTVMGSLERLRIHTVNSRLIASRGTAWSYLHFLYRYSVEGKSYAADEAVGVYDTIKAVDARLAWFHVERSGLKKIPNQNADEVYELGGRAATVYYNPVHPEESTLDNHPVAWDWMSYVGGKIMALLIGLSLGPPLVGASVCGALARFGLVTDPRTKERVRDFLLFAAFFPLGLLAVLGGGGCFVQDQSGITEVIFMKVIGSSLVLFGIFILWISKGWFKAAMDTKKVKR